MVVVADTLALLITVLYLFIGLSFKNFIEQRHERRDTMGFEVFAWPLFIFVYLYSCLFLATVIILALAILIILLLVLLVLQIPFALLSIFIRGKAVQDKVYIMEPYWVAVLTLRDEELSEFVISISKDKSHVEKRAKEPFDNKKYVRSVVRRRFMGKNEIEAVVRQWAKVDKLDGTLVPNRIPEQYRNIYLEEAAKKD